MRKTIMSVIVLLAMSLAACGPDITAGVIVGKQFIPAHYDYITIWVPQPNGIPSPVIVPDWQPNSWRITLQSSVDGSVCTGTFNVSKDLYESIEVGQYLDLTNK